MAKLQLRNISEKIHVLGLLKNPQSANLDAGDEVNDNIDGEIGDGIVDEGTCT